MTTSDSERDLLYLLLALKNGLVDRGVLADALRARDGATGSLGRALRDRGGLDPEDESLLDGLVRRHLVRHGGDPGRSVADLDPAGSVRRMLSLIAETRASDGNHPDSTRDCADGSDSPRGDVGPGDGPGGPSRPRFRIVRPHARGGLGEVYLAVDDELNRIVALKRLQERHADDPRSQMRFLVEGEITGGLEHPGIVPVYGLGFDDRDGRPYYAMRFIGGESLKEAIRRFHEGDDRPGGDPAARSLALRQLLGRFVDVCDAIEYAHSRGVLHRDVKPANIMLGRYGETLVVDWGLAKASGRAEGADPLAGRAVAAPGDAETILRPRSGSEPVETVAGSVCGTPQFMSPEQAAGDLARLGPASDVYSLGATLYGLLTGRPPFREDDVSDVLAKVVRGEFPPPRSIRPDVPAPLEAVCLKAMARAPEARYPSPRRLAQDIERWLADEPVSARREPWAERARRWARRHRSLVAGAAAALVVALIALGGILARESASNRRLRLANAREARAREQAQARFLLARDAVAGYYRGVSEDVLLRRTEFRDLRRSLLKSALDFYQKLAMVLEGDQELEPTARLELARADAALARITGEIGSSGDALKAAQQARDLFARLAAERPDAPDLRRELADLLLRKSDLHTDVGQPGEALDALREAQAIRRELAGAPGATPDDRRALGATYNNIGTALDGIGRPADALLSYEDGRKIFEALVAERPDEDRYAGDLARVVSNIGIELAAIGRLDLALRAAEESHAVRKRLAAAHLGEQRYQGDLAGSFMYLGRLRARIGRLGDAIESIQQAAAINRALVAANPNTTSLRRHLANNYNDLGDFFTVAHRTDEALRAFEQARAIQAAIVAENPDDLDYANNLATSLVNIGLVHALTGRADRALPLYEEALALRRKLSAASPDDIDARSKLAWTGHNIGQLHAEAGRPAEALGPMEEARAIRQSLVDAHRDLSRLRADLAESLQSLGHVHDDLGHAALALQWLARARDAWEALDRAEPRMVRYRRSLAWTQSDLSRAYRHVDRVAEALKSAEEARAILSGIVRDQPEDDQSRDVLGRSWTESGAALARLRRYDEAVAALREALALYRAAFERAPQDVGVRRGLSDALGQLSESHRALGRPEEAAAAARAAGAIRPRLAASPDAAAPSGPPADLRAILLDLDFPPDPFR